MAAVRRWWHGLAPAILAAALGMASALPARGQESDFVRWLEDFKRAAAAAGISAATIAAALDGVQPIAEVIELDRRQPEFTQTFWAYLDKAVTPDRIARARALLETHRALLDRVHARYGVQPRFLVALWGLESNFGGHTGRYSVIAALATLAHDTRRSAFFRTQLLDALKIIDEGSIAPADMRGSWAGAMGQLQFIPSTFVNHAVDFDGDRRRDIWQSLPDIFASAANYLQSLGWRGDETWGREVRLSVGFDWDLANPKTRKSVTDWRRLGVTRADGGDLPDSDILGAIALPMGHGGPAFLTYRNFEAILSWNRSVLYAVAVGHLADRIAGAATLATSRPAREQSLSRAEIEEMQGHLGTLGFAPGGVDGIAGEQTRAALKAFQRQANLIADGFPSIETLEHLRRQAAQDGNVQ